MQNFRCHSFKVLLFPAGRISLLTGASGTGKSTVFMAIQWCLFGGLRGFDLKPIGVSFAATVVGKRQRHRADVSTDDAVAAIGVFRKAGAGPNSTAVAVTIPGMCRVVRRSAATSAVSVTLLSEHHDGGNVRELLGDAASAWIVAAFGSLPMWQAVSHMPQGARNPLMTASAADRFRILYELTFGTDAESETSPEAYLNRVREALAKAKSDARDAKAALAAARDAKDSIVAATAAQTTCGIINEGNITIDNGGLLLPTTVEECEKQARDADADAATYSAAASEMTRIKAHRSRIEAHQKLLAGMQSTFNDAVAKLESARAEAAVLKRPDVAGLKAAAADVAVAREAFRNATTAVNRIALCKQRASEARVRATAESLIASTAANNHRDAEAQHTEAQRAWVGTVAAEAQRVAVRDRAACSTAEVEADAVRAAVEVVPDDVETLDDLESLAAAQLFLDSGGSALAIEAAIESGATNWLDLRDRIAPAATTALNLVATDVATNTTTDVIEDLGAEEAAAAAALRSLASLHAVVVSDSAATTTPHPRRASSRSSTKAATATSSAAVAIPVGSSTRFSIGNTGRILPIASTARPAWMELATSLAVKLSASKLKSLSVVGGEAASCAAVIAAGLGTTQVVEVGAQRNCGGDGQALARAVQVLKSAAAARRDGCGGGGGEKLVMTLQSARAAVAAVAEARRVSAESEANAASAIKAAVAISAPIVVTVAVETHLAAATAALAKTKRAHDAAMESAKTAAKYADDLDEAERQAVEISSNRDGSDVVSAASARLVFATTTMEKLDSAATAAEAADKRVAVREKSLRDIEATIAGLNAKREAMEASLAEISERTTTTTVLRIDDDPSAARDAALARAASLRRQAVAITARDSIRLATNRIDSAAEAVARTARREAAGETALEGLTAAAVASIAETAASISICATAVLGELFRVPVSVELSIERSGRAGVMTGGHRVALRIRIGASEHDGATLLSGGESDRVSLAMTLGAALARGGARFLLIDEAFASLDSSLRDRAITVARRFLSGKTVINVCHGLPSGMYDSVVPVGGVATPIGGPSRL